MPNMKSISLTVQKLWQRLRLTTDKQAGRQIEKNNIPKIAWSGSNIKVCLLKYSLSNLVCWSMVQIVIHSFVISCWKNSADSEEILYILIYLWTMLFLTVYSEVTQVSLMFISKHMMIQIYVCIHVQLFWFKLKCVWSFDNLDNLIVYLL